MFHAGHSRQFNHPCPALSATVLLSHRSYGARGRRRTIWRKQDDLGRLRRIPRVYEHSRLNSLPTTASVVKVLFSLVSNNRVFSFQSRQNLVTYLPLPSADITKYQTRRESPPRAFDCGLALQTGPDLSQRDTFKSRAYLAQKRRDQWSRVSPAVSELMSRSGTRMSSARQSTSGELISGRNDVQTVC